jgi:predicted O-linked N-acetylglucosamine transferase (SPINDLY family)
MDCVVDSAEAYAETAYRLVHDKGFRTSVREKIRANAPKLFNDTSAIGEISDIFEQLILESR